MYRILIAIFTGVVLALCACSPNHPDVATANAAKPNLPQLRQWKNPSIQKAALEMRQAVADELAAMQKELASRDDNIASFVDASADPVQLVESLAARIGIFISRDDFEREMLKRFEADVLASGEIQTGLVTASDRVRLRWASILDALAQELASTGHKVPDEVRASLLTPAITFDKALIQPVLTRQLQRAATLAGSFALAPGLAKASLKLISVFFDTGKWFARWSSIVGAGVEVALTVLLDRAAESTLGLREGVIAQIKQLLVEAIDGVTVETAASWTSQVDKTLESFAAAAGDTP